MVFTMSRQIGSYGELILKYRSYINRKIVASTISENLLNIDYDNFKNSVSKNDVNRSNAYMSVWSALYKMQNN